jgi:hypothetical protein
MTRILTKVALGALVAAMVYDAIVRSQRRVQTDGGFKKEAISTWEHEGGALPNGPAMRAPLG